MERPNHLDPELEIIRRRGFEHEARYLAEEAQQLGQALVDGGATWIDQDGRQRTIIWQELLIVAPYNAQVGAIRRLLP